MVRRPLWGWILALSFAACTFTVDKDFCLENAHCDDDAVCGVSRRCIVCAGDLCPPSQRCGSDDDCDDEETCATDGVCRPACVVDAQCTKSGLCRGSVCAAAFGEPCDDEFETRTPCADECVGTDNKGQSIPKFCSTSCLPEPCPAGFECVSDACRIIAGDLTCQHPDPSGVCGSCLWQNCGSRLADCCEGQICGDVFSRVAACDQFRTTEACSALGSSLEFPAASEELLGCIRLYCDEGACF